MDTKTMMHKLQAVADHLRGTRIPIGEKTAIERLLGCAETLDSMAKELMEHEADNQQGTDV